MKQTIGMLENLLREGKHSSVRSALTTLEINQIPRKAAGQLAQIARRAYFSYFSLRLLNPIVRGDTSRPTAEETAEYALALNQIGAHKEALSLIQSLPPSTFPDHYLYLAFSYIYKWDYGHAILALLKHLERNDLTPYDHLTARVNLAAAYVSEFRLDEAQTTLSFLWEELESTSYDVLKSNVLELSAQLSFLKKDWEQCSWFLIRAEELLSGKPSIYSFFIAKWWSILYLFKDGTSKSNLLKLDNISQIAVENQHWETIRECSFYRALATEDRSFLTKIYFGTPYSSYRKKMFRELGGKFEIPSHYDLNLYTGLEDKDQDHAIFSLERGMEINGSCTLRSKQRLMGLLSSLTADLFKPLSLGGLFSDLFPNQYFDPASSQNRVHQLLHRMRAWAKENNVPLNICYKDGFYQLNATTDYSLRLSPPNSLAEPSAPVLNEIQVYFGDRQFRISDVVKQFRLPKSTATRAVNKGRSQGIIERIGSGKKSHYLFKKKTPDAA